jgi:nitric oxide reductase subunit C
VEAGGPRGTAGLPGRPRLGRRVRSALAVGLLPAAALVGAARLAEAPAAGDAARGEQLFTSLPCASCHDIAHPWPGGDVCPNLGNVATEAARIVRSPDYHGRARDAAGYLRESIVDPDAYLVPGAAYRTADGQSVMPKDFGRTLTAAQIDDLVAFLSTRRGSAPRGR